MRIFTLTLSVFAWLSLIGATISLLYYYDPTRIFFMGLKSKNSFAFDPLPEDMRTMDLSEIIRFEGPAAAAGALDDLKDLLYPNGLKKEDIRFSRSHVLMDQENIYPDRSISCEGDRIELWRPTLCMLPTYQKWENLAKVTQYELDFPFSYKAFAYVLEPKNPNGQAIIYHHGYAGTYHDQLINLMRLIEAGYRVGTLNIPKYGENDIYNQDLNPVLKVMNGQFDLIDRPLSMFLDPVHALINEFSKDETIKDIHMMGLSAGAWVTSLAAALDDRISKSYPIAGVMPLFLRQGDKERAAPQFYKPLLETANYMELFTLGANKPDRRQVQIFNRYDRCCFNNIRGKLYEKHVQEAVSQIGGGSFDVWIDDTHARHKISSWAMNRILEDLAK